MKLPMQKMDTLDFLRFTARNHHDENPLSIGTRVEVCIDCGDGTGPERGVVADFDWQEGVYLVSPFLECAAAELRAQRNRREYIRASPWKLQRLNVKGDDRMWSTLPRAISSQERHPIDTPPVILSPEDAKALQVRLIERELVVAEHEFGVLAAEIMCYALNGAIGAVGVSKAAHDLFVARVEPADSQIDPLPAPAWKEYALSIYACGKKLKDAAGDDDEECIAALRVVTTSICTSVFADVFTGRPLRRNLVRESTLHPRHIPPYLPTLQRMAEGKNLARTDLISKCANDDIDEARAMLARIAVATSPHEAYHRLIWMSPHHIQPGVFVDLIDGAFQHLQLSVGESIFVRTTLFPQFRFLKPGFPLADVWRFLAPLCDECEALLLPEKELALSRGWSPVPMDLKLDVVAHLRRALERPAPSPSER